MRTLQLPDLEGLGPHREEPARLDTLATEVRRAVAQAQTALQEAERHDQEARAEAIRRGEEAPEPHKPEAQRLLDAAVEREADVGCALDGALADAKATVPSGAPEWGEGLELAWRGHCPQESPTAR